MLKKLHALIQAEKKSQKVKVIMELRHKYDLELLLKHTKTARSSFYYHQKQNKSTDKYKAIKEFIIAIYHKHKRPYGYRRITDELNNNGIIINHKTVLIKYQIIRT